MFKYFALEIGSKMCYTGIATVNECAFFISQFYNSAIINLASAKSRALAVAPNEATLVEAIFFVVPITEKPRCALAGCARLFRKVYYTMAFVCIVADNDSAVNNPVNIPCSTKPNTEHPGLTPLVGVHGPLPVVPATGFVSSRYPLSSPRKTPSCAKAGQRHILADYGAAAQTLGVAR